MTIFCAPRGTYETKSNLTGGGLKRQNFQKIFLHPVISYITTVISTCSFVSHDYVPPPYLWQCCQLTLCFIYEMKKYILSWYSQHNPLWRRCRPGNLCTHGQVSVTLIKRPVTISLDFSFLLSGILQNKWRLRHARLPHLLRKLHRQVLFSSKIFAYYLPITDSHFCNRMF